MHQVTTILIFLALTPASLYAQELLYELAAPLPGGKPQISTFFEYVKYFVPFLLSLASILALVMFTIGAIEYMFSEGGEGNKDGKDKMTSAIFGILLAAGSVLILQTINPKLVTLSFEIEQLTSTVVEQPNAGCTSCGGSCWGDDCVGGKTCANKGNGPKGPFLCESPPTSCSPSCGAGFVCITNATGAECVDMTDLGSSRECTAEQAIASLCPPGKCGVESRLVMGRMYDHILPCRK